MFEILRTYGVPEIIVQAIAILYKDTEAKSVHLMEIQIF